ncbi:MAG: MATE family efflux transporter [Lachnospiraceae bacterium]|nr:MATE family efflux transporter [Lachnospiraceae bacterium]
MSNKNNKSEIDYNSSKDKSINTANEDRRKLLTETPIPKLITKLAIPTIISMLVTAIYNAADTYFVGRISTEATAAVGLVFSVMAIIQAMGFFCGHGSGNYLSRMLGANKEEEAKNMASTGFFIAITIGVILAGIGNFFAEPIAYFIGANDATIKDTVIYMKIIFIGAPFMTGQFVINNQLRFQGNAFYAMIGLMCGAVVNVFLDPLFILVLKWGVAGAALATITGQITSFIVLLIGSMNGKNIRLSIKNIHVNGHYLLEIVNGGAPSLFRQGLAAVSTMLLNNYAGIYGGTAAIAGMSIVTRVMMFVCSALIGFGQGYQPVCSFNYGAGIKKRVKEGYFFCVRWGTVFLTFVAVLCFIFAPEIIRWFRDDDQVVAIGRVALRYQSCVLPLFSVIVMTNMMLQSIGRGVKASIASSSRNGIFFIPLILILPQCLGLLGVEICQTCADVLSFALAIPLARSELKDMN